jgi:hypothetical protein
MAHLRALVPFGLQRLINAHFAQGSAVVGIDLAYFRTLPPNPRQQAFLVKEESRDIFLGRGDDGHRQRYPEVSALFLQTGILQRVVAAAANLCFIFAEAVEQAPFPWLDVGAVALEVIAAFTDSVGKVG